MDWVINKMKNFIQNHFENPYLILTHFSRSNNKLFDSLWALIQTSIFFDICSDFSVSLSIFSEHTF